MARGGYVTLASNNHVRNKQGDLGMSDERFDLVFMHIAPLEPYERSKTLPLLKTTGFFGTNTLKNYRLFPVSVMAMIHCWRRCIWLLRLTKFG